MILVENIDRSARKATLTLDFQALHQIYVSFYTSLSNNHTMSVEDFNQLKVVHNLIEYGMLDYRDVECMLNNYERFKEKKDE